MDDLDFQITTAFQGVLNSVGVDASMTNEVLNEVFGGMTRSLEDDVRKMTNEGIYWLLRNIEARWDDTALDNGTIDGYTTWAAYYNMLEEELIRRSNEEH